LQAQRKLVNNESAFFAAGISVFRLITLYVYGCRSAVLRPASFFANIYLLPHLLSDQAISLHFINKSAKNGRFSILGITFQRQNNMEERQLDNA